MFLRYLLLSLAVIVGRSNCDERPSLEIAQGKLTGFYSTTRNGRKIEAYTTIPFAEPPVGPLRFQAPVPHKKWEGVLDASKEGPICVQRNPYIRQEGIHGQEDCLYLNVYVPAERTKPLPVMVWFHGGGLMCGAGTKSFYGPDHLLDRDVIFVGTNYRLGPLGFLSTQDEWCPGNNGLKDQQQALRWVQQNIHLFGGDNTSVTIFGESAGGASVHLHMLSPTSSGLFHKGISQSGTAMVPWGNAPPGEPLKQARNLAKLLSCPFTPSGELVKCLRTKTAEQIIDTEFDFYFWDLDQMTAFKPVVEPEHAGAFISRPVRDLPRVPSVPWMTGLTSDEGCMKSTWLLTNGTLMREFSHGFNTLAPVIFYYENSPDIDTINKKLLNFYLGGKKPGQIDESDKRGLIDLYSDSFFAYALIEALRLHLQYTTHPTYLYYISYKSSNSFSQIFGDPIGDHGVCHADDIQYLFPIDFLKNPRTQKDEEMTERFLDIWTNFAATGNPNTPPGSKQKHVISQWKPVSSFDKREYFEIGNDLKMGELLSERSKFWDSLPLWQRFHDYPTSDLKANREEL